MIPLLPVRRQNVSFRGALCSLLTVIVMFLFAGALAIFQTGSEKAGFDLRSALTNTMSDLGGDHRVGCSGLSTRTVIRSSNATR